MLKKFIFLLLFLLSTIGANAQTPKLVYSKSMAAPGQSGNGFKITYGGATGSGSLNNNLITLRITSPHGSVISTITDNLSQSYSLAVSVDSGVGGWITSLYYKAGTASGVTLITVTYTSSVADWHGAVMEYSGVSTSSPLDGTCSGSSTVIQCSSAITTTGSNDLVIATSIGLGSAIMWNRLTGTIVPGGSFILDAADTQASDMDEEFVQASAGSVTPSFAVTGSSQAFNIVGAAFKSASAGTNPIGMYILHQQDVQVSGSGPANIPVYFVSSGNLLLASFELGVTFTTYTISGCNPSNTWTAKSEGSFWPQFFFIPSSGSFSTNLHCTVGGGGVSGNGMIRIYDVVGAAVSPFDTLSRGQSQGNGGFVTGTVTPTKGPGIMFAAANDGTGPVTNVGVSGTVGALFDNTVYTGETDTGQLNNGDAWQHLFFTSASPITFTWTMQNSSSFMQASAIIFDAPQTPWAGIIASNRAIDWRNVGVVGGNPTTGGLPSDSWTQCSNAACNALATPANVMAANINTAIAGAPVNTFVQLPAGTFTIGSPGIIWNNKSNVELRGQGANSTFLVFTASNTCQGTAADVCFQSADPNYQGGPSNIANWTAGYTQGSTTITLSSTPNLKVGNPIILDQVDDASDPGAIYSCINLSCATAGSGGYTRPGPPSRSQDQMVTVTQCDGNSIVGHACSSGANITISPGLYMPNWNNTPGTSLPQAWWATSPISNDGIRNLSLDHSSSDPPKGTEFFNCFNCWQSGTRSIYGQGVVGDSQAHVLFWNSPHGTVQNSYFFHNRTTGSASVEYGVALGLSSDTLVQNNIFEQVQAAIPEDGPCSGCVVAYNFDVNNVFQSLVFQNQGQFAHSLADNMLYEGNTGAGLYFDNFHGTHNLVTVFRSAYNGFQQNQGNITNQNTSPFLIFSHSRFLNIIGGVLGSPALPHTTYQTVQPTAPSGIEIYSGIGWADNSGSTIPNDPTTLSSLMRWGNYSIVTQASDTPANSGVRFVASEVPSGIANFPNPVPANNNLPASFYLTSKPSWWSSSIPYPSIGPDVTGGNLSVCLGGVNKGAYVTSVSQCPSSSISGLSGHANTIPSVNCFLTTMNGSPIGTDTSALSFNPSACFSGSSPSQAATPTFSPVSGSYLFTQIVAINSATASATICYTNDGTIPTANGSGTCTHGATITNGGTVTVSFTQLLQAIASESGFLDSAVGSASYSLPTSGTGTMFAGSGIKSGSSIETGN